MGGCAPQMHLGVCVADITIEAEGEDDDVVIARLGEGASDMLEFTQRDLRGEISIGKAAMIANSPSLVKRLRGQLGPLVGDGSGDTAAALGVDLTPGGFRGGVIGKGKRRARWVKVRRRLRRLANVARTLGASRNPVRFYTAGVASVAAYDAPVYGLATGRVTQLRRWGGAHHAPERQGAILHRNVPPLWRPRGAPRRRRGDPVGEGGMAWRRQHLWVNQPLYVVPGVAFCG